jgi:hypothetical protein
MQDSRFSESFISSTENTQSTLDPQSINSSEIQNQSNPPLPSFSSPQGTQSPYINPSYTRTSYHLNESPAFNLYDFEDFFEGNEVIQDLNENFDEGFMEIDQTQKTRKRKVKVQVFEHDQVMRILARGRKISRTTRYPPRNKVSPVRWWLGERAVYENGYLIGKDIIM